MLEKKIIRKLVVDEKSLNVKGVYSFLNPYSFHVLRKSEINLDLLDGFYADGSLLCAILNRVYGIPIKRQSFDNSSLAPKVFEYVAANKKSIIFVGGTKEEVDFFSSSLKERYPGLKVDGAFSGYDDVLSSSFIRNIIDIDPDYVVAGLGTPLQEKFLLKLKSSGWDGVGFSCGGFISQFSIREDYFPLWANRFNLRWVVRLVREPHVLKRILRVYPNSILALLVNHKYWKPD